MLCIGALAQTRRGGTMADKDSIRRRIGALMDDAGLKYKLDDDGDYWVPFQDAIVFVGPGVMGEIGVAKIWAYVAVDVNTSDISGLLAYLNEQNCKMIFGKLCWYPETKKVIFESPVVADALDKPELQIAVLIAAKSTDDFNDVIVERWGGKKFTV
jgi:hypothetical protein